MVKLDLGGLPVLPLILWGQSVRQIRPGRQAHSVLQDPEDPQVLLQAKVRAAPMGRVLRRMVTLSDLRHRKALQLQVAQLARLVL